MKRIILSSIVCLLIILISGCSKESKVDNTTLDQTTSTLDSSTTKEEELTTSLDLSDQFKLEYVINTLGDKISYIACSEYKKDYNNHKSYEFFDESNNELALIYIIEITMQFPRITDIFLVMFNYEDSILKSYDLSFYYYGSDGTSFYKTINYSATKSLDYMIEDINPDNDKVSNISYSNNLEKALFLRKNGFDEDIEYYKDELNQNNTIIRRYVHYSKDEIQDPESLEYKLMYEKTYSNGLIIKDETYDKDDILIFKNEYSYDDDNFMNKEINYSYKPYSGDTEIITTTYQRSGLIQNNYISLNITSLTQLLHLVNSYGLSDKELEEAIINKTSKVFFNRYIKEITSKRYTLINNKEINPKTRTLLSLTVTSGKITRITNNGLRINIEYYSLNELKSKLSI